MKKLLLSLIAIFGILGTPASYAKTAKTNGQKAYACCVTVGSDTWCNKFMDKTACNKACPNVCVTVAKDDPVDTAGGIHVGTTPEAKAYYEHTWSKRLKKKARKEAAKAEQAQKS